VKLGTNPRIIVKRTHANGHFGTIGPVAPKQTRATSNAKSFDRLFAFAVSADQLISRPQMELFLPYARLGTNSGSGMFPAAIAMAMACSNEGWLDFKTDATAKTAASDHPRHALLFARALEDGRGIGD